MDTYEGIIAANTFVFEVVDAVQEQLPDIAIGPSSLYITLNAPAENCSRLNVGAARALMEADLPVIVDLGTVEGRETFITPHEILHLAPNRTGLGHVLTLGSARTGQTMRKIDSGSELAMLDHSDHTVMSPNNEDVGIAAPQLLNLRGSDGQPILDDSQVVRPQQDETIRLNALEGQGPVVAELALESSVNNLSQFLQQSGFNLDDYAIYTALEIQGGTEEVAIYAALRPGRNAPEQGNIIFYLGSVDKGGQFAIDGQFIMKVMNVNKDFADIVFTGAPI